MATFANIDIDEGLSATLFLEKWCKYFYWLTAGLFHFTKDHPIFLMSCYMAVLYLFLWTTQQHGLPSYKFPFIIRHLVFLLQILNYNKIISKVESIGMNANQHPPLATFLEKRREVTESKKKSIFSFSSFLFHSVPHNCEPQIDDSN